MINYYNNLKSNIVSFSFFNFRGWFLSLKPIYLYKNSWVFYNLIDHNWYKHDIMLSINLNLFFVF